MALTLDGNSGLVAQIAAYGKGLNTADAASYIDTNDLALQVNAIRQASQNYLIKTVNNDTQLRALTVEAALEEVIEQAISQSESCDAPVANIGLTPLGVNSIDTYHTAGCRYGQTQSAHVPHFFRVECVTGPNNNLNYTAEWRISSPPRIPVTQEDWFAAQGVGFNGTFRMATAREDGFGQRANDTCIANGSFERWTSNVPDQWAVVTGTAGTHIQQETTNPRLGGSALKFVGQASANTTKIRQIMNDPTGTMGVLHPHTWYMLRAKIRRYSTGAITGTLRISVEDASANELYSSGVAIDLSTIDTDYETSTNDLDIAFWTGDAIATSNYAVIELTTTMGNTHELYIDDFIIAPMIVIPGSGRYFFSETPTRPEITDYIIHSVGNDGSAAQLKLWERLFDMSTYDLCMPVNAAGAETILDSLSISVP